ncbi:glycosyltransferase family 2 protein [Lutibacter sp.]
MIYISILIAILYFVLIITFIIGFNAVENIENKNSTPKNTFSIVIPFRDEAENLPKLFHSLLAINYPPSLFEIILINDNSKDNFNRIIEKFTQQNATLNILLLINKLTTNSPKKDAINLAVKKSKFEWIVTTDADCVVPTNWLQIFNQHIEEKQPMFISAPVKFQPQNSVLFYFQDLNFTSLIGSSIGSFGMNKPFMCNGANLCYSKNTFFKVNGFEGNSKIASGDDVFLLEKFHKAFPNKTSYLKATEAIVQTKAATNFNSFFNQQIRWASKSTAYTNTFSKVVGLLVFTMNLVLITMLIIAIVNPLFWKYLLLIYTQKLIIDFILIFKTSSFLKNTKSLKFYLLTSLLYPFFIVFIGIIAPLKNYTWKGRNFSK